MLDEVVHQRAAGLSVAVLVNTNATLVDEATAARWAAGCSAPACPCS
ncbi:hypothetical protein ABXN37_13800 [Piscinibacter sakaiensis]